MKKFLAFIIGLAILFMVYLVMVGKIDENKGVIITSSLSILFLFLRIYKKK